MRPQRLTLIICDHLSLAPDSSATARLCNCLIVLCTFASAVSSFWKVFPLHIHTPPPTRPQSRGSSLAPRGSCAPGLSLKVSWELHVSAATLSLGLLGGDPVAQCTINLDVLTLRLFSPQPPSENPCGFSFNVQLSSTEMPWMLCCRLLSGQSPAISTTDISS